MDGLKIVSRRDLYDSDTIDESFSNEGDDQECYEPPHGLEIEELSVKQDNDSDANPETQDEFDFPLFSFGSASAVCDDEENRGSSSTPLVKISLKEPIETTIEQKRPHGYYFAEFTPDDHKKFQESAIEVDEILKESQLGAYRGWPQFRGRILNVKENNTYIEKLAVREKHCKKRRPGKKQRIARKQGAINEKERQERNKEIKKMIKKKFHKRGGVKNNKKSVLNSVNSTTKKTRFRTE